MSKTLHRNLQAKIATLQGPEWDSSDEEQENISQKKFTKKKQSIAERKRAKKHSNKKQGKHPVKNDGDSDDEGEPTVVYIGHLPNEFEESDLRDFLSQFGKLVNCRISRSIKSGRSRGYSFVKFSEPETAKIVANTMQGYFLGKRRLVSHLVPNPSRGMFFDTAKVIEKKKIQAQVDKKRREQNLTNLSKLKEITGRLVQREKKKRKKFQELGIDYDFPGYEANTMEEEVETSPPALETDKTSKKKKRKDSVDSVSSSSRKRKDSISSETSTSKKKKRKDSVDSIASSSSRTRKDSISSETSTSKKKKSKRKESIGSVGSIGSSSSKGRKRSNSGSGPDDLKEGIDAKNDPQSEQKKKKKKKKKSKTTAP